MGECTKACPKQVDPAGAIQQYKLAGAADWFKSLLSPGDSMSARAPYTLYHPKWYRAPRVGVVVAGELVLYRIRPAGAYQRLRGLLRRGTDLGSSEPWPAGPEAYAQFMAALGYAAVPRPELVAFFFVLFHAITWFNLAPKAMVVRLRGKRVPDLVIVGVQLRGVAGASAVVAFFLLEGDA